MREGGADGERIKRRRAWGKVDNPGLRLDSQTELLSQSSPVTATEPSLHVCKGLLPASVTIRYYLH